MRNKWMRPTVPQSAPSVNSLFSCFSLSPDIWLVSLGLFPAVFNQKCLICKTKKMHGSQNIFEPSEYEKGLVLIPSCTCLFLPPRTLPVSLYPSRRFYFIPPLFSLCHCFPCFLPWLSSSCLLWNRSPQIWLLVPTTCKHLLQIKPC